MTSPTLPLPHNKMYVISYHETNHTNGQQMGSCTARLTGMNPSTQIHPVILSWLAENWEIKIGWK
jgi:ABC-type transport system substrate-binding protein